MDLEGLEQTRADSVRIALGSMEAILKNDTATFDQKIEAAKIVGAFSETQVKAYIVLQETSESHKTNDKLIKQIDKLTDKD